MTVHVYVGPSLPRATVAELLPDAVTHPPVAHGDLLRESFGPADRVVLLDGVFHQSAAVRHKEILHVLGRGAAVLGASSMGALRAAELGPFGMVGHGVVYRLYATGLLEADDEVALLHDESGDWTPRTVAMVSVRMIARRMRNHGLLTVDEENLLLHQASRLPFAQRSWPALLTDLGPAAGRVRDVVTRPRTEWDVKAQDAVRALRRVRDLPPPPTVSWPVTGYLARWRQPPEDPVSIVVTAAQLFADDYPALHYRTVLQAIAGEPEPIPSIPSIPLSELEEAAVRVALRAKLVPEGDLRHHLAHWLDPDERFPDRTRLVAAALVRSYRWAPDLPPLPLLHKAIEATPGAGALHRLVADVRRVNAALHDRGYPVARATRAALRRLCLRRWATSALTPALYTRGFVSTEDLYRRAQPLCAYGTVVAPPPLALMRSATSHA